MEEEACKASDDWMGVWGKRSFPHVREKRSKALPTASLARRGGRTAATMNDDRAQLAEPAQREPAREATEEEQSSPGRLPWEARRENCSDDEGSRTLSRREPTVEVPGFARGRLDGGPGEATLPPAS